MAYLPACLLGLPGEWCSAKVRHNRWTPDIIQAPAFEKAHLALMVRPLPNDEVVTSTLRIIYATLIGGGYHIERQN